MDLQSADGSPTLPRSRCRSRAIVADKGYDTKTNREAVRERGICPVIRYRSNTIDEPKSFAKVL